MKLLLDENLSPRLPRMLAGEVEAVHVREAGLRGQSDEALWRYEFANQMVIVSKDWDFVDMATAQVPPPWVVHLDIGNCTVEQSAEAVRAALPDIALLCSNDAASWMAVQKGS